MLTGGWGPREPSLVTGRNVNHQRQWEKQPRVLKPTCPSITLLRLTRMGEPQGTEAHTFALYQGNGVLDEDRVKQSSTSLSCAWGATKAQWGPGQCLHPSL